MSHAAWEHDDSAPLAPPPTALELEYRRLAERTHLPRHPLGPAGLVLLGIVYCIWLAHSMAHAHLVSRIEWVTAVLLLVFAIVPGVAMILTGAWDLAESPLEYYQRHSARRETSGV